MAVISSSKVAIVVSIFANISPSWVTTLGTYPWRVHQGLHQGLEGCHQRDATLSLLAAIQLVKRNSSSSSIHDHRALGPRERTTY